MPILTGDLRNAAGERGYQAWSHFFRTLSREHILDIIEDSTLTGKGGAGFPTHKKMRLMFSQTADRKYVVINGSEHEPGSFKDRYLLDHYPHKVLEGALLSAGAVGATDIVFAINETLSDSIRNVRAALQQAQTDAGVDFAGIRVSIRPVPNVYIVGEESALLEVLEGHQPLPRKKPPFPTERGLNGFPTLVQNVETVAHLPFILMRGAAAYRALGVNGRGVTLCTLGEEFASPGIHEIPLGTPIRDVLYGRGGGLRNGTRIKAIQPGGPSSGFLAPTAFDLPLDAESLKARGSALGCGVIKAFSEKDCMVREIEAILQFFAQASCGQCPRCRMETGMLDTILKQVLAGKGTWKLLDQVPMLIKLAKGEGICTLINMPVAPITTGMDIFREEFDRHIVGACPLCDGHDG